MVTRTTFEDQGLLDLSPWIEAAIYDINNPTGAPLCVNQNVADVVPSTTTLNVPIDYNIDMSSCPNLVGNTVYAIAWMLNTNVATNLQVFVNNFDNAGSTYFVVGQGSLHIPANFSNFGSNTLGRATESWIEGTYLVDACQDFPCAIGIENAGESCTDLPDAPNDASGRTCAGCGAGIEC